MPEPSVDLWDAAEGRMHSYGDGCQPPHPEPSVDPAVCTRGDCESDRAEADECHCSVGVDPALMTDLERQQAAEIERLTDERNAWQMSHEECNELRVEAQIERDQMRSVVAAARHLDNCMAAADSVWLHINGGGCLHVLRYVLSALDTPQPREAGHRG